MRLNLAIYLASGLVVTSSLAAANEVRVVRFNTASDSNSTCAPFVIWSSQTLFHNSTDTIQAVQFLGVSNGDSRPNPRPLLLPPHQTAVIEGTLSGLDWEPVQRAILWVNRLDVPPGVIVANRVVSSVYQLEVSQFPCFGRSRIYAGLPLPVFPSLIPAGTPQYFLGTDVGEEPNTQVVDARLNVGVYNEAGAPGSAVIRVYCGYRLHTDSPTLLLTDQMQIPPNSLVQKTVLASTQAAKCPSAGLSFWYATVTVDQPSYAYAIGMANGALPTFPGVVALTYTGN